MRWTHRAHLLLARAVATVGTGILASAASATDIHFDYTSFDNANTPGVSPHFGQAQFNVLNYPSITGNYMMTSTDTHRPEMTTNNNALAEFYNNFLADYNTQYNSVGGLNADAEAAAINAYTVKNSATTGFRPNWMLLNELSASVWPDTTQKGADYRAWCIGVVAQLHDYYAYNVVTFAPFATVGTGRASDWQLLTAKSYVGVENYLSGAEVMAGGSDYASRVAWAQAQYQASVNTYGAAGVPKSKLVLTEEYANTTTGTGWGRGGIAASDWDTVIQIRQDAIDNVGFPGFAAYAWGSNGMLISEQEQIQHEYYYRTRLVMSTQQPQWLADDQVTVNAMAIPLSWNNQLNWMGGVPSGTGAVANFFRTNTAARTITLDGNITAGTVTFNSPNGYTIASGTSGTLTLDNGAAAALVSASLGAHTISAPVVLAGAGANFNIASNVIFTLSGGVSGSAILIISGPGTLQLTATNTYTGLTRIDAGFLSLSSIGSTSSITVNAGGSVGLSTGSLTPTLLNEITASATPSVGGLAIASFESANNIDFTTSPLNATNTAGMSIGAIGNVIYTGTITPSATLGYRLGGGGILTLNVANKLTGTRNVTIANGGTVVLAASNNYIGTTSLTGGTLNISADSALGNTSNPIVFNGGALQFGAAFTIANSRTISLSAAGGTIDTNSFNISIAQNLTGSGALTKSGAGTLTLTGANTYSGGTTFAGGTLNTTTDARLGNTVGGLTFDGGTFQFGASFNPSTTRAIAINSTGTVDTNTFSATLAQAITGSGSLIKSGSGTLTLSGANTYAGGTKISGGVLKIMSDSSLGDPTSSVTVSAATLQFGAIFALANTRSISLSSATIDVQGFNGTILPTIIGAGGLQKLGTGTLTLGAANNYTGTTTISAGTLAMEAPDGALSTWSGVITGAGAFLKTGPGAITLSNTSNSWTGGTTISGGVLGGSADTNFGAVPATFNPAALVLNGGTWRNTGTSGITIPVNRGITVGANGGTLDYQDSSGTPHIASVITGSGSLTKMGYRTLLVDSNSAASFSGNWNVTQGRLNAQAVNSINSLGTGSITLAPGAGDVAQLGSGNGPGIALELDNAIVLAPVNGGIPSFEINSGNTITFAGNISGSGALQKSGGSSTGLQGGTALVTPGTMILNGNNNYTGGTIVNDGTLIVGHPHALGSGGLTIATGATVNLASSLGQAVPIQSLTMTGTAKLDMNNDSLIVNHTGSSPAAGIRQLLISGYASGDWSGTSGITSSTAHADTGLHHTLAYAEASALGVTSFGGQPIAGNAVLVKYTYPGDSNLDGIVDLDNDFSLFVDGYNRQSSNPGSFNAGNLWVSGDYNYDGVIDLDNDFSIFVNAYNFHGPQLSELQQSLLDNPDLTSSQKQAMQAAVPEPGIAGLFGVFAVYPCLKRRRRA